MRRSTLLILFAAGLAVAVITAVFEPTPGYMDADYYYAGAQRIAAGQGGTEPYLWNYLNDPPALPALSFAYWMPLTSLVSAVGVILFPWAGWWGARFPFLLAAGLIPVVTAMLAWRLSGDERQARLAGVLALAPGFYLAYLPTTDVFAIEMLLGGLFLLTAARITKIENRISSFWEKPHIQFFLLGILVGLLHSARADGLFWGAGVVVITLILVTSGRRYNFRQWAGLYVLLLAGYLLVMSPWLARNTLAWGTLFPPAGSRAIWITEYEQTMLYPADLLTPQWWLAAGWKAHLAARINALSGVLQTALAVQGNIVLFPFILSGLWIFRKRTEVKLGAAMWALIAVVMVLAFPAASINGSFFHSAAALQTLFWAAAPAGLGVLVSQYCRWRRIEKLAGFHSFVTGLVIFTCVLLSGFLFYQRVAQNDQGISRWSASHEHYLAVETELQRYGAAPGEFVLVNNPPGYWLASQRPAMVIPYGGTAMLLAAAEHYHASFVVLERTNPYQLADLYYGRTSIPGLEYLTSVGETQLYRVHLGE
jgi:hypothetical protein